MSDKKSFEAAVFYDGSRCSAAEVCAMSRGKVFEEKTMLGELTGKIVIHKKDGRVYFQGGTYIVRRNGEIESYAPKEFESKF